MQLPIPDDWNGLDTCDLSVCWPDSVLWRGILHGLLEMPSQGRFWDFTTGNFLELRETFKPIYDANFEEFEEVLLSCNDDKFNQFLEVISGLGGGSGCGCGSGGAGSGDVPDNPYSENDQEGVPPDGFDTVEQYRSHKCDAAWHIFNQLNQDLQGLSGVVISITAVTTVAALLVTIMVTPVPGARIVTLAAILIFGLVAFSFLSAASALMFDNRFDLICYLYDADSSAQAKIDFLQGLAELMDSDTVWDQVEKDFVLAVVDQILSPLQMNKLTSNVYVPSAAEDCDHCAECQPFFLAWGSFDDETQVLSSQADGSSHRLAIMFNSSDWEFNGSAYCGPEVQVDFGAPSGGNPDPTQSPPTCAYRIYDDAGDLIYCEATPWSESTCGRAFYWRRDAAFTVSLIAVVDCEV